MDYGLAISHLSWRPCWCWQCWQAIPKGTSARGALPAAPPVPAWQRCAWSAAETAAPLGRAQRQPGPGSLRANRWCGKHLRTAAEWGGGPGPFPRGFPHSCPGSYWRLRFRTGPRCGYWLSPGGQSGVVGSRGWAPAHARRGRGRGAPLPVSAPGPRAATRPAPPRVAGEAPPRPRRGPAPLRCAAPGPAPLRFSPPRPRSGSRGPGAAVLPRSSAASRLAAAPGASQHEREEGGEHLSAAGGGQLHRR